jgi:RHS repeat-associated protein
MATPEGRATYANNNWQYEFFYSDHLGNARVSFSAEGQNLTVNDISDFDPTGISLKGIGIENPTENRFKYQNKESLALFGLSSINDFDARYADKTITRFWSVDALSEQMENYSPYNISFNNPLSFIDPDGNEGQEAQESKSFQYSDGYSTLDSRNSRWCNF